MSNPFQEVLYAEQESKLDEAKAQHPYHVGYAAHSQKKTRQDNPYKEGSEGAAMWAKGWEHASDGKPKAKFTNEEVESVAEGPVKKVPSHAELAKSAWAAAQQAVRLGNSVMADHYAKKYEKHKRLAASEKTGRLASPKGQLPEEVENVEEGSTGWHPQSSEKNPNFNNDLSGRRVSPPGKRLKSGDLDYNERTSQERLKSIMKFTKKTGGLAGPKGKLPEEVEIDESAQSPYHKAALALRNMSFDDKSHSESDRATYAMHANMLRSTNPKDHEASAKMTQSHDTELRDQISNAVHRNSSKANSANYHKSARMTRLKEETDDVELEEAKGALTYTPKVAQYAVVPDSKKQFVKFFKTKDQAHAHAQQHGGKVKPVDQAGRTMKEEVELEEGSYMGKGNHRPGWMLRADPELAKKFKEIEDRKKAKAKTVGKTSDEIDKMKKEEVEIIEAKVGDTVSFHHELKASPGTKIKKSGTVEKVQGDDVHVKVKDRYGVKRHQIKMSDIVKEEVELEEAISDLERIKKGKPTSDDVRRKYYSKMVLSVLGDKDTEDQKNKSWKRYEKIKSITDPSPRTEEVELEEKTLTKAELKKREEVAKAMEREKPGMPMSKKMAIATAVAKRVAEQNEETE